MTVNVEVGCPLVYFLSVPRFPLQEMHRASNHLSLAPTQQLSKVEEQMDED